MPCNAGTQQHSSLVRRRSRRAASVSALRTDRYTDAERPQGALGDLQLGSAWLSGGVDAIPGLVSVPLPPLLDLTLRL